MIEFSVPKKSQLATNLATDGWGTIAFNRGEAEATDGLGAIAPIFAEETDGEGRSRSSL